MPSFVRVQGIALCSLSEGWAAFSPLSGSTDQLNEETAAMLECFDLAAALSVQDVCTKLAKLYDQDAERISAAAGPAWEQLVNAGLIREFDDAAIR